MSQHAFSSEEDLKKLWPKKRPWSVDWVMPAEGDKVKKGEIYPEAHTHGLRAFNHLELQIRALPFESAGYILNALAIWIASGKGRIEAGDTLIFDGEFKLTAKKSSYGGHGNKEDLIRLAWSKDK